MAERVDQLIPWGYAETAISTFHAFGDRVLRESALEAGLDPQFRVLSQPEQVIFLRERLFHLPLDRFRPLGDPTRHLAALATLVSRAKDEDVSPRAVPGLGRGEARGRRDRGRAGRGRHPPRARGLLRGAPEAARRGGARGLRRPDPPHPRPAARAAGRARAPPRPLPLRPRGRVPGHEPRPARDAQAPGGGDGQPHRGGRRRPGHLPLAGRGRGQPAGLPSALPGRARGRAGGELPLHPGDPRHGGAARRLQQPLPARGDRRDRQAAPLLARERPPGAPRALRHRVGGGRRRRRDDRRSGSRRAPGRGTSRSSCAATPTPTLSSGRSTSRASRTASAAAAASTRARRCASSSRSSASSRTPTTRSRSSTSWRPRSTGCPRETSCASTTTRGARRARSSRCSAACRRTRTSPRSRGSPATRPRASSPTSTGRRARCRGGAPARCSTASCSGRASWGGWRRSPRPRRRRRSGTSPASSRW